MKVGELKARLKSLKNKLMKKEEKMKWQLECLVKIQIPKIQAWFSCLAFGDHKIIPQNFCRVNIFTFPQQEHCFLRLKGNSRHSMRSTKSFMIQNQANPQCGCGIVSGMLADYSVDEIYDRSSWLFEIHDVWGKGRAEIIFVTSITSSACVNYYHLGKISFCECVLGPIEMMWFSFW